MVLVYIVDEDEKSLRVIERINKIKNDLEFELKIITLEEFE